MTKSRFGTESVVGAITALILLPIAIYCAWIAWQSWNDGDRFREAPTFQTGQAVSGTFYRVQGEPVLTLKQPEAYPEIRNSIQYKVEEQALKGGEWETQGEPRLDEKQLLVAVGDAQVEPTSFTLYSWPVVTIEKSLSSESGQETRLLIRSRPILPENSREWVVYGTYQQGRLTDGNLQRLIVMTPEAEPSLLAGVEAAGHQKAVILLIITLVLAAVGAFAARGFLGK